MHAMNRLRWPLLGLVALVALMGYGRGVQASTITVDTTSDANLSACTGAADDCSLR